MLKGAKSNLVLRFDLSPFLMKIRANFQYCLIFITLLRMTGHYESSFKVFLKQIKTLTILLKNRSFQLLMLLRYRSRFYGRLLPIF